MTEKVEFVPLKEAREEVQNPDILSGIKHIAFAKVTVEHARLVTYSPPIHGSRQRDIQLPILQDHIYA